MPDASPSPDHPDRAGQVQAWGPSGSAEVIPDLILICEHASNHVAPPWIGADTALLASHAASDLGALGLAQALGAALAQAGHRIELIHAPLSRLIYDLNRSPDRIDACPAKTEIHDVPMNQGLQAADRLARMEALYLPFHNLVRARVARALALGSRPAIVTVHSYTPIWHGRARDVEFGVIHDDLPALAQAILAHAEGLGLKVALNQPYSAADHVTHTLRLHALPYGLDNAMLEIRNDLLASPAQQTEMATRLAPVISRAVKHLSEAPCPAQ
ncbi:MAG: N-formylglutamate amidohydrolase [Roseinatronobacter sp.]